MQHGKHFNKALIKYFKNTAWLILKIIFIIEDAEITGKYEEANKNHT